MRRQFENFFADLDITKEASKVLYWDFMNVSNSSEQAEALTLGSGMHAVVWQQGQAVGA